MILETSNSTWFKGTPITYGSAGDYQVDLAPFKALNQRMRGPVVKQIRFDVTASITTVTALTAEDSHKIFTRITCADRAGRFYDLPGSNSFQQMLLERGYNSIVSQVIGSSTTLSTAKLQHYVDFNPQKATRGKDYGIPLPHFTDGGYVTLGLGVPVDATINSMTVTPYFKIVDERRRELKPRVTWTFATTPATQAEFVHPTVGSLRALWISSNLQTSTGYTAAFGATTTVESNTLQLGGSFPARILAQDYQLRTCQQYSASDHFLTTVGYAIPFITPSQDQHIGMMLAPDGFHVKLSATLASGVIAVCQVQDRDADLALSWTGLSSINQLEDAVMKNGYVVESGGGRTPASQYDVRIRRRLPIRLPGI